MRWIASWIVWLGLLLAPLVGDAQQTLVTPGSAASIIPSDVSVELAGTASP